MRLSERSLFGPLADLLARPPGEALGIVWLGQAGFVVDGAGLRVVIDPYLSDSLEEKYRGSALDHRRQMPAPVAPDGIRHVTAVLSTHAHGDHMDPGTLPGLLAANPGAVLVAPAHSTAQALERGGIGPDRLRPIDAGQTLTLGPGLEVTATRAAHESLETDAEGRHRWLGFALRLAGATVFHSGDTIPFEGQVEEVRALRPDVMLLPVNGRGKGVPGNMTPDEAASLARGAGAGAAILHHFGLFAFNTVPRPELDVVVARVRDIPLAPARPDVIYRLEPEAT
ncbi:MBL fold metallo-hydrolase [Rubellimicrobium arenae]|uniref:MBL fold metallo-hydrolase n=1 Tax=Rubellimicrobium arenae TaxID=2817372 RepID=UPI001B3135BA|nr:MBL fold metallo-hydrolase [Rubellimicrobium arenae]